jgi:hypothetical protein
MHDPPTDATSHETFRAELESAIKQACDDAGADVRAGLRAALDVCRDRLESVHDQIRESNRRHGVEHPERTLVRNLPPELQELNARHREIRHRIKNIEEVLERVVVRPDGKTIILPRGHQFAGFSEDGKVISGHMTVVHHEDRRRSALAVARPAQRRTRGYRPGATRRTASSSTTSSSDPPDSESEPPGRRGELRHISDVLANDGWICPCDACAGSAEILQDGLPA